MSSSTNSEKTPSWQLEREAKTFEKYGLTFHLHIVKETRPQWAPVMRDPDGNVMDRENKDALQILLNSGKRPNIEWELTGDHVTSTYVQYVTFRDQEELADRDCIVEVYSTADGPILGILHSVHDDHYMLMDPCIVQYDANKGSIQYLPIFNVARGLILQKSAVRARSAPAEIIVASYPGFIMQNRMSKYQLKANVPFAWTDNVDNDADEAVTTEVI